MTGQAEKAFEFLSSRLGPDESLPDAIDTWIETLAAETAGRVRVTTLVPGVMHTAFFDDRDEQYRPPEGAALNRPQDTAATVLYALRQPPGCEVRELVVCHSEEGSWP